jgi:hypothetical protein
VLRLHKLLPFFILVASSAMAADKDDFYTAFLSSMSFHGGRMLQNGANLGYCPFDTLGLGVYVARSDAIDHRTQDLHALQTSMEIRWFQEPFEISADFGVIRMTDRNRSQDTAPLLGFAGAYLFALTPSIAAKLEVRWQFPFSRQGRLFSGLGAQMLF